MNAFTKHIIIACGLLWINSMGYAVQKTLLHQGWSFKQQRGINWMPAKVPGTVHTDLMHNNVIDDPFFRLNERSVQWVDKEDWVYRTTFNLSPQAFNNTQAVLHFEGLDTYADVTLNGVKILTSNNMFRRWRTNVKTLLKERNNELEIYFHSPLKIATPLHDALPYRYHSNNDQAENGGMFQKKVGVFVRKAGYHFGWDWGPRIVTSGIWRPVWIETWNDVRISDVQFTQPSVTAQRAQVVTQVEVEAATDGLPLTILVTDMQTGQIMTQSSALSKAGTHTTSLTFEIKNPSLWWSNGLGKAHLYRFRTTIQIKDNEADATEHRIGIRSLRLVTQPDKHGTSFHFELNGTPIFAKGANYIPSDVFLPRLTPEMYRTTILDAAKANMNMLRVWGGGVYEENAFYDLCDEYGILVWQDFMFACSMYPAEGELLENIRLEAIDNVKRLRNHPCIALWCGNNEILEAWFHWGWKKSIDEQNPAWSDIIWQQYCDLFYTVLPNVVKEFQPEISYRSSSPFNNPQGSFDPTTGDTHYWKVWHGKEPFRQYNNIKSRFFSEYGFQSFPEFESIKRFAPLPHDWSITSEVLFSHQRGGDFANQVIAKYISQEYREPKDFESFIYTGLILQGDAIKTAMEAHRRDMGNCMGTLFWQHNDCWPVASWSSRDYYGRWKAQHYFARKAYADILVSPIQQKENEVHFYVITDRLLPTKGKLHIRALSLTGETLFNTQQQVNLAPNASSMLYSCKVKQLLCGKTPNDVVITASFTDDKEKTYTNNYFLVKQKEVNLPTPTITTSFTQLPEGVMLRLTANTFTRATYILLPGHDYFVDDNFFDLLPGETREVMIRTPIKKTDIQRQITIRSLADTY